MMLSALLYNEKENSVEKRGIAGRVLVIDHEMSMRRFYKIQLSHMRFEFDMVLLGHEGLEKLNSWHSMVIIEMTLPDVDGLTIASTIRERFDYLANIPIIAVSRLPITGIRQECQRARINALLKKPLAENELRSVLMRYANKISTAA